MPQISGELIFPPNIEDFTGARIVFKVEDTGMPDASAAVHYEAIVDDVAYAPRYAFNLTVPESSSQTLTFSAHVDIDHSGNITRGDYLTTQSYPVLRDDRGVDILSVQLERV